MAKKIYLSPAAHATDNSTKCPTKCSENTHANQYMDIVERRLKECGFEVKRGNKSLTGSAAMQTRVREANSWKADIYYVAHTNAGGGRYSMTMCYTDAASKAKANVIHKYRKCVSSHKVVPRSDLYEIKATAMPCLYDELFFHDNADDCKWFHGGGMEKLAEETVQALCEICGVTYKEPVVDNADKHTENAPVSHNSVMEWQKAAMADGFEFPKYGADGVWGAECERIAKKAVVKQRKEEYLYPNLTKFVQEKIGFTGTDIDGMCGPRTCKAIGEYQTKHNLVKDCCAGINTYKVMLNVD